MVRKAKANEQEKKETKYREHFNYDFIKARHTHTHQTNALRFFVSFSFPFAEPFHLCDRCYRLCDYELYSHKSGYQCN